MAEDILKSDNTGTIDKEATDRIERSLAMHPSSMEYLELRAHALDILNRRRKKNNPYTKVST
jgi:hypothetical protein